MGYDLKETITKVENTTKEEAEKAKKFFEKNHPEREYQITERR